MQLLSVLKINIYENDSISAYVLFKFVFELNFGSIKLNYIIILLLTSIELYRELNLICLTDKLHELSLINHGKSDCLGRNKKAENGENTNQKAPDNSPDWKCSKKMR